MFWLRVIFASIIGAIVGAVIGLVINKIVKTYNNYRLRRMMKKTDKALADAFTPILDMDQPQW